MRIFKPEALGRFLGNEGFWFPDTGNFGKPPVLWTSDLAVLERNSFRFTQEFQYALIVVMEALLERSVVPCMTDEYVEAPDGDTHLLGELADFDPALGQSLLKPGEGGAEVDRWLLTAMNRRILYGRAYFHSSENPGPGDERLFRRFMSYGHWRGILEGAAALAAPLQAATPVFHVGRGGGVVSEETFKVFPPCLPTNVWGGEWRTTGWLEAEERIPADYRVPTLGCWCLGGEDPLERSVMSDLHQGNLPGGLSFDVPAHGNVFKSLVPDAVQGFEWGAIRRRLFGDGEVDFSSRRPCLPLLWAAQCALGCMESNYAEMPFSLSVPHRETTRTITVMSTISGTVSTTYTETVADTTESGFDWERHCYPSIDLDSPTSYDTQAYDVGLWSAPKETLRLPLADVTFDAKGEYSVVWPFAHVDPVYLMYSVDGEMKTGQEYVDTVVRLGELECAARAPYGSSWEVVAPQAYSLTDGAYEDFDWPARALAEYVGEKRAVVGIARWSNNGRITNSVSEPGSGTWTSYKDVDVSAWKRVCVAEGRASDAARSLAREAVSVALEDFAADIPELGRVPEPHPKYHAGSLSVAHWATLYVVYRRGESVETEDGVDYIYPVCIVSSIQGRDNEEVPLVETTYGGVVRLTSELPLRVASVTVYLPWMEMEGLFEYAGLTMHGVHVGADWNWKAMPVEN